MILHRIDLQQQNPCDNARLSNMAGTTQTKDRKAQWFTWCLRHRKGIWSTYHHPHPPLLSNTLLWSQYFVSTIVWQLSSTFVKATNCFAYKLNIMSSEHRLFNVNLEQLILIAHLLPLYALHVWRCDIENITPVQ